MTDINEVNPTSNDPDVILGTYKQMLAECQQIAAKIQELNQESEEHRLVIDQLSKLEAERKAFRYISFTLSIFDLLCGDRLVGSVLVERNVGEVLPIVQQNYEGIKEIIVKLEATLKTKDNERRVYKDKHGIMTQEEREAMLRQQKKTESR